MPGRPLHDAFYDSITGACKLLPRKDGMLCDYADPCIELGTCVPGFPCSSNEDCDSRFCVDGVCCKSECTSPCHSCALPFTTGTCTLEPEGQDLNGDCSAGEPCVLTCSGKDDPNDWCTAASAGSQCAPAQCIDRTHSMGPAACIMGDASTLDCPAPILEDCGDYSCNAIYGTCGSQCVVATDCAAGRSCNLNQQCVPPPPKSSGETPLCTFAPHSSTTGFPTGFASIVAFLGIAFSRRRHRFTRAYL